VSTRNDPREPWSWEEEERDRVQREVEEHEGRLARDTGDPRWGTGGMPAADERALSHAHHEPHLRRGPSPQREVVQEVVESEAPSYAELEPPASVPGPYSGVGPRGYRRGDERIRDEICERFTQHGYLDPSDVDVSVRDGEAMLTGSVATRGQKRLAEDLAESVAGVIEVHNHLHVQRRVASPRLPRSTVSPEALPLPENVANHR
jgi:hypothetical protein